MTKVALCNVCNADIFFDSYSDINGEVMVQFDNWVCSECDNDGKYEDSNRGYSIQEVEEC